MNTNKPATTCTVNAEPVATSMASEKYATHLFSVFVFVVQCSPSRLLTTTTIPRMVVVLYFGIQPVVFPRHSWNLKIKAFFEAPSRSAKIEAKI